MLDDGCTEWRAEASSFALGDIEAERRAGFLAHLQTCPTCRREVGSLAGTVDTLISVAPPVAPSEGFIERTLARLPLEPLKGPEHRPPPGPTARQGRHRSPKRSGRWGKTAGVLAASLAALAAAVAIAFTASGGTGTSPAPSRVTVTMRNDGGRPVGRAVLSDQRPALISVDFDVPAGSPDDSNGRYEVIALRRDGEQPLVLGVVMVSAGHGGLQARTDLPLLDIVGVQVLRPDGTDLCAGRLPPPPPGSPRHVSGSR